MKFLCFGVCVLTEILHLHLLAQHDSILQTLHEAISDLLASHILDPQPQLFLLVGVVLPCKLREEGGEAEVRGQT